MNFFLWFDHRTEAHLSASSFTQNFTRKPRTNSGGRSLSNMPDTLMSITGVNPASLRYVVTTLSHPTRELWRIWATPGCYTGSVVCVCVHIHTRACTHTFCFSSSLFLCLSFEHRKRKERRSEGAKMRESSQTSTPAATTAVSHRVFGCFCECMRVCVRARVCVCVCVLPGRVC